MQSPHVVSPSYGGNGLVSHTHPLNTLNMDLNPGPPGGSSRGSSPGPSPSQRRRPHHQLQNLQLSPRSQNHSQNQSSVSSFKIVFYIMRVNVKRNPKWMHDVIRYSVVCSIWHVHVSAFFYFFLPLHLCWSFCLPCAWRPYVVQNLLNVPSSSVNSRLLHSSKVGTNNNKFSSQGLLFIDVTLFMIL